MVTREDAVLAAAGAFWLGLAACAAGWDGTGARAPVAVGGGPAGLTGPCR